MNLLYIASDPRMRLEDTTGYGSHIRKTVAAFRGEGHSVLVLVGGDVRNIGRIKDTYRKIKGSTPSSLIGFRNLIRDIYEVIDDRQSMQLYHQKTIDFNYQFIYERSAPFRRMGQRLSRKMGVPLVLEINDPISETLSYYPSPLKKYAALVEKNIIWHAKGVVVGSLALRDYFINQGFPSDKFIVIYPTADYSLFDSSLYSGNISSHAKEFISIGFIGNMRAWHRVDLLLQAFNQVYRNIRNVRLEIVGDGPEMGKIRKVTEDLGIGQVVCFRGSVPYSKIPEVIAGFDICTIPNATWYGSPTKLFEYAAMGKAIVGNSCSPVAEIIEDGKNGFLFDSADPNSLAQALMRLVKDNDLRDMLGERILEKVRTEITWEKNIDKILKVL